MEKVMRRSRLMEKVMRRSKSKSKRVSVNKSEINCKICKIHITLNSR